MNEKVQREQVTYQFFQKRMFKYNSLGSVFSGSTKFHLRNMFFHLLGLAGVRSWDHIWNCFTTKKLLFSILIIMDFCDKIYGNIES
jgi:hypothetical protein